MKILFDTSTPAGLAYPLREHEVIQSVELGWHGLEDGALLTTAEQAGFEIFITCDQSIPYQQNFSHRKIAVLILSTNNWPTLRPLGARIAALVDFLQHGQVRRIDVRTL